jgi:hypothetical protein
VAEAGLCSGLRWRAISMAGREVSRAVFTVPLARLVGLGDFGIVAQPIVHVGIVALLLDQGFSSALISCKHAEKEPDQVDGHNNGSRYGSRYYADGNDQGWGEWVRAVDGFPDTVSASSWVAEPDRVATKAASALVDRLRRDYEYVIIAAPPVLSTLTASAASGYADAVLLLIFVGTTIRPDVLGAAESLKATGAPLIGAVLVGKDDDGVGAAQRSLAQAVNSQHSEQSAGRIVPMTTGTFECQES